MRDIAVFGLLFGVLLVTLVVPAIWAVRWSTSSLVSVLRMRGRATGTIVGLRTDSSGCGVNPCVRFMTSDGIEVEFWGPSLNSNTKSGANLPVRYSEHDPNHAAINTFGGGFAEPALLLFLGISSVVGIAWLLGTTGAIFDRLGF